LHWQGNFEEAEASFRAQIKILEDELARQKVGMVTLDSTYAHTVLQRMLLENFKRYRTEQELMLSVLHTYGMREARDHLGAPVQQSRPGPTSWLGLQRKSVSRGSCNISLIIIVRFIAWTNPSPIGTCEVRRSQYCQVYFLLADDMCGRYVRSL
jgi:hypothetical protein